MPGEYYIASDDPNDDNWSTIPARRTFLEQVNVIAPQIPVDLERRIKLLNSKESEQVLNAISQWAQAWNLTDTWVLNEAIWFLNWGGPIAYDVWIVEPFEELGGASQTIEQQNLLPLESGSFSFSHEGFDMQHYTIAELQQDIAENFKFCLGKYINTLQNRARIEGWQSPTTKRPRNRVDSPGGNAEGKAIAYLNNSNVAHFAWLARFQCLRETQATIAKDAHVKIASVSEAIRRTAKLIGLTLRTSGRGRPKKRDK